MLDSDWLIWGDGKYINTNILKLKRQDRTEVEVDFEDKDDVVYKALMNEAVAKDWDSNPNEWYHLPIVLAIPDLKVYAWC